MRLAVVGDIHQHFDAKDVAWLDAQKFSLILFTGDLPGRLHQGMSRVLGHVSGLRTRAVWIPGNHDAPTLLQLVRDQLPGGASAGLIPGRLTSLRAAVAPVEVGGYSVHAIASDTALLVGRPMAMDGRRLSFARAVRAHWGVENLDASGSRLKELVDAHDCERWFVLAHNGPAGLGAGQAAPWGIAGRDLGDPDLAEVVDYLKRTGRQVPLVVAGHVHHRAGLRGRVWHKYRAGTQFVNAARVPRHERDGTRHVVVIEARAQRVDVRAVTYR